MGWKYPSLTTVCDTCSYEAGDHRGSDGACPDQNGRVYDEDLGSPRGHFVPAGMKVTNGTLCSNCGVRRGQHFVRLNGGHGYCCPCNLGGQPSISRPKPEGVYGYYIPLVSPDELPEVKAEREGRLTEVIEVPSYDKLLDMAFDWESYNNELPSMKPMRRKVDPYTGLPIEDKKR